MVKVSICIPAYNQEQIIGVSIISALDQDYQDKEILVIDDASTDMTVEVARKFFEKDKNVRILKNDRNKGLGGNLNRLMKKSRGEYMIVLCGDDMFTHKSVVSDMIKIFEHLGNLADIGVIGRPYYQYMDGHPGAVMVNREGILPSSCQPSGIAFRKKAMEGKKFSNKIFIEMPSMVKQIIRHGWDYKMMDYDTIAARLHPGVKGNAASAPSYYDFGKGQSIIENWSELMGEPRVHLLGYIQLKNRYPRMLWSEIKIGVKVKPKILLNPVFWFCVTVAVIVPGFILRPLSNFYRHRISRRFVRIKERGRG